MKGERLVQTAAAIAVLIVWAVLQIIDARSETYSAPQHATWVMILAAGFLFGVDISAVIRAVRGRTQDPKGPTPDEP